MANLEKKLYMATNLEELNKRVELGKAIYSTPVEKLIKSSEKILGEADHAFNTRDEELAYVYYMRYFTIVQSIQTQKEYKVNKKYYSSLLKSDVIQNVISKADKLSSSLERRYKQDCFRPTDNKNVQMPERKYEKSENTKSKKGIEKLKPSSADIDSKNEAEKNFITCPKLISLIKEKASSFLVIDIRPKDQFNQSSLKLSSLINISEEMLNKGGFTPVKIGRNLDENSSLLWEKRNKYDYLIICDEATDAVPFPSPIVNLITSLQNWDPGKLYKANPTVLLGGYELFRAMYPMFVTNPQFVSTASQLSTDSSNYNSNSILNFDFPDLDIGFTTTPSPDIVNSSRKLDMINNANSTEFKTPIINRNLKPFSTNVDEETNPEFQEELEDSSIKLSKHSTVSQNSSTNLNNGFTESRSSLLTETKTNDNSNLSNNGDTSGGQISSTRGSSDVSIYSTPSVPSRSLKPNELLDSLKSKEKDFKIERELLEQTYKTEEESIKSLEELDKTHQKQQNSKNENEKKNLANEEVQLRNDIKRKDNEAEILRQNYKMVSDENEKYRKFINCLLLPDGMKNLTIDSDSADIQNLMVKKQIVEWKAAQEREEQRQNMLAEVDLLRKHKKELLKKITKYDDLDSREQKQWAAERNSRNKERSSLNSGSLPKTKNENQYTNRLKSSPRGSPVRGSNIKRSHSALDLSRLSDDSGHSSSFTSRTPNFDRSVKPHEPPRRRNIKEARQRNFEPKYGNVGPGTTGLKNLGNTCYMNSIVQCLNNTKPLVDYFYKGLYSNDLYEKSKQGGDVAVEFWAVIWALWNGQYRSISMLDLKNIIGRYHNPYQGRDQHDAHEFLLNLMDWLHNDLNKSHKKEQMEEQDFENIPDYVAAHTVMDALRARDRSIIRDVFYGLHRSVIICGTCSTRSLTFEQFSVLTVSFPESGRCSLKEMLYDFYRETNIEYRCSKCCTIRNCTRKLDIWKLPPILVIQLNRFEHDINRDLIRKQQCFVDFPLENLDLEHHLSNVNVTSTYDLYGVSNHYGTIDGGHYTAFCKSSVDKIWRKFDDHEVYELPRESVRTSAAYILFYETKSRR